VQISWDDLRPILPALILMGGALVIVGVDLFRRGDGVRREILEVLAYITLLGAFVDVLVGFQLVPITGFGGAVSFDHLAVGMTVTILAATAFGVCLANNLVSSSSIRMAELLALFLLSASGMILLVSAQDLVTLFLALELMSMAVFVLTGITRFRTESTEAAMKYFVIGSFASALLLYGFALLYGFSGSVHLDGIARALQTQPLTPAALLGLTLALIGFGFKIGAVPFHSWVPDAYQGAPTAVTAFMSAGVKAAGFGALIRFLAEGALAGRAVWFEVLVGLAVVTMLIGNLLAIAQSNLKRMLAYSSIAHTGYLLIGVCAIGAGHAASAQAVGATTFYLLVYAFMTLGSFASLILMGVEEITDFEGMAKRRPWSALMMTVFLVSLAGFPPTGGFFAKFFIFKAALNQPDHHNPAMTWLVVAAVITTVVSVYYYLKPVVAMYFKPSPEGASSGETDYGVGATVVVSAMFTLLLGLAPTLFLRMALTLAREWLAGLPAIVGG